MFLFSSSWFIRFAAGLRLRLLLVRPKFDIAVLTERTLLHQTALLLHQLLDGDVALAEDAEVVADDVAIAALRTGNENGAVVVALLGDIVMRPVAARQAGEGQLVVGRVSEFWTLAFARRCIEAKVGVVVCSSGVFAVAFVLRRGRARRRARLDGRRTRDRVGRARKYQRRATSLGKAAVEKERRRQCRYW
jgi:hypothetical protein